MAAPLRGEGKSSRISVMRRLFLALNFDEPSKRLLADFAAASRPSFRACTMNWVNPALYHLTLYFFGEADEEACRSIVAELGDLDKKLPAPTLLSQEVLFLPNEKNPRTFCIGFRAEPRDSTEKIVEAARRAARSAGLPEDRRPWLSHLSLARLKYAPADFAFRMREAEALSTGESTISLIAHTPQSFDLMESRLLPGGPRYSLVRKYMFYAGTMTL